MWSKYQLFSREERKGPVIGLMTEFMTEFMTESSRPFRHPKRWGMGPVVIHERRGSHPPTGPNAPVGWGHPLRGLTGGELAARPHWVLVAM